MCRRPLECAQNLILKIGPLAVAVQRPRRTAYSPDSSSAMPRSGSPEVPARERTPERTPRALEEGEHLLGPAGTVRVRLGASNQRAENPGRADGRAARGGPRDGGRARRLPLENAAEKPPLRATTAPVPSSGVSVSIASSSSKQDDGQQPGGEPSGVDTPRTLRQTADRPSLLQAAAFLPGAQLFAASDEGGKALALYSLKNSDPAARTVVLRRLSSSCAVAASPSGAIVAVADSSGWTGIFEVARWLEAAEPTQVKARGEAQVGGNRTLGLAFSGSDSERLLSLVQNGALMVRDARSAELVTLATFPNFRGGGGYGSANPLSCAGALVAAVGGTYANPRSGDADSGCVRVWRMQLDADGDSTSTDLVAPPPLCALDLAVDATSVALRPCGDRGTQLVVGTGDGVVLVYEKLEQGGVERGRLEEPGSPSAVYSLTYSPDGMLLAAGRDSGMFTVYEVSTAAAVARFEQGTKSHGLVSAWAPAGDVLAVGGGDAPMTFRSVRSPASLQRTLTMADSNPQPTLSLGGACVSASGEAALVCGSLLVVRDVSGRLLVDADLGEPIETYPPPRPTLHTNSKQTKRRRKRIL